MNGATERRTDPLGAFLTHRHDDDDGTLQLAIGAIYDRRRYQWTLHALYRTVSGALIAIAFAGQASSMGTAFFVFSLVLFPSLFFMGLFTFERVLQAGIEDLIYARGITRIRQLYLEHAPQMQPYFIY